MNKNVLIAFGGATLIAIVVAMLLSAMLKGGKEEQQAVVAEVPKTQILVAVKPIGVGNLLTEENIKWKTWPVDAVFPGTVERIDKKKPLEALSGRAIRTIAIDEPILKTAIVSDDGGFLAAALEPGTRAVAVNVGASTMAGGFINPGDFVDVILTYRVSFNVNNPDEFVQGKMQEVVQENVNRHATETILKNIKVLGVDQRATKGEETGAKVGKTITLQVTERQAEVMALGKEMGDISLSLRPLGDDEISDPVGPVVSDVRIIRMNREIKAELKALVESAGGQQHNVRIYNGGEVDNLPTR